MNEDALKESIRRELPGWLRTDPDIRAFILELTRSEYANRAETGDRFYVRVPIRRSVASRSALGR